MSSSPAMAPARAPAGLDTAASGSGSRPDAASIILGVVLGLGALGRLSVAFLPEDTLLSLTWDDAFYYFGIAEHVVNGAGSTFDGINSTNGYHPLWLLVISPFTAVFGDGTALVRVLVLVQGAMSVVTAILFIGILRPRVGYGATALGLALWWLAPVGVITSVAGLETSLACLAIMLGIHAALRYVEEPSTGHALLLGSCLGLAFLARSDSVFASVGIGSWLLWNHHRQRLAGQRLAGQPYDSRSPFRDAVWVIGAALAVASPWLVWNLMRFGTIQQDSATARPMVLWERLESQGTTGSGLTSHIGTAARSVPRFLVMDWPAFLGWSTPVALAGVIVAVVATRNREVPPRVKPVLALGTFLLVTGTVLGVFHGTIRLVPREYYFEWVRMSLGIVSATVAAIALSSRHVARGETVSGSSNRFCMALTGVICVLGIAGSLGHFIRPVFSYQEGMVSAGRWLREHTDPDDRILSFNAGIIGYFSDRSVINLDGVVNNAALDALRSDSLAAYMCSTGAEWYADFDPIVVDEHTAFMGPDAHRLNFERVATMPAPKKYVDSYVSVFRFSCDP